MYEALYDLVHAEVGSSKKKLFGFFNEKHALDVILIMNNELPAHIPLCLLLIWETMNHLEWPKALVWTCWQQFHIDIAVHVGIVY